MTYQEIKSFINTYIVQNGVNAITGAQLNTILNELADYKGFDSVVVTTLPAGSDATATVQGMTLVLGIPKGADGRDGQDAVNPFKGWFTIDNIPTTGQAGDYCNVSDTSTTPPTVTIYRWNTTTNQFEDTGEVPDTATGDTFASGEELNEVAIDDSHLTDPVNTADPTQPTLARADDAMQLKSKVLGPTLDETKASFVFGNGYIDHNGAVSGTTTNANAEIDIPAGYDSIRFLGLKVKTGGIAVNYCYGFFDTNNNPLYLNRYVIVSDLPSGSVNKLEYIVPIPAGAVKLKCSIASPNRLRFYCYLRKGSTLQDEVDKVLDEIHGGFFDLEPTDIVPVVNPDTPAGTTYQTIRNAAVGGIITDYYDSTTTTQKIWRYAVEGGKEYYLSGTWRINYIYNVATWVSAAGVIVKLEPIMANDGASNKLVLSDYKMTAPEDAAYLYLLNRIENYHTNPILKDWHAKDFTPVIEKPQLRILAIGNSYSQDALAYLPFILPKVTDTIDLTVGILYEDGAKLSDHWDNWQNERSAYILWISQHGQPWSSQASKSIQYAIDNYQWDVIVTHQQSSSSYYPSDAYEPSSSNPTQHHQPYLNKLINAIQARVDYPVKFGWMLIQARPAQNNGKNYTNTQLASNFAAIVENAQKVLNQTVCEFVVPWGTAIQNARTIADLRALGHYSDTEAYPLNTSGNGYLTYDGVHLQEGLPCLIAAYTVLLSVLEMIGETCRSIIGDDTVPNAAWLVGKNMPGPNGTAIGANIDFVRIAQLCAVMAYKNPYSVTDMNYIVNPT